MNYKSFSVTVIGGSHIKEGLSCQDFSDFYYDKNMSIAVVADGHGDSSCFRSNIGSEYAVNCAVKGIQEFVKMQAHFWCKHEFSISNSKCKKCGIIRKDIEEPPSNKEFKKTIREKLIKQIVASWNRLVMEEFQRRPFTEDEISRTSEKYQKRYTDPELLQKYFSKAYGTSLIAAVITDDYWFGFHIGDGRFTVLKPDGNGEQPVPWDEKCYLNVTTSICDDDILDRDDGVRIALSLNAENPPPIAFFLCSDGIDDNYPVEGNEKHLYRLYREIAVTIANDGYESVCGKDGKSGQIKDLAEQFATKGKGDDTSLAGIINIEEMIKVAPVWKEKIEKAEAARALEKAEKEKAEEEARQKEDEKAAEKAKRREEKEAEKDSDKYKDKTPDLESKEKTETSSKSSDPVDDLNVQKPDSDESEKIVPETEQSVKEEAVNHQNTEAKPEITDENNKTDPDENESHKEIVETNLSYGDFTSSTIDLKTVLEAYKKNIPN